MLQRWDRLKVVPYTVDEPAIMQRVIDLGVNGIITDNRICWSASRSATVCADSNPTRPPRCRSQRRRGGGVGRPAVRHQRGRR
ncbi:glycerophosphodiester phosphodiesterase family protein [Micromonospora kangleipakensis]|uniref:glycerophosphodiester phosphodiesterase family protein n=1 Tax=Micromonospora kangleipakensis TaxID=1077942 RepID=UPI003BF8B1C3